MTRRTHRGGGGPPDSGVLSERVDGLQSDFAAFRSEVGGAIKALGDKIDAKSQTPWSLIGGAASLAVTIIIAIGSMAFSPVNQGLTEMRETVKSFAEKTVSEKELAGVVASASARRDDAQRQTEARFARVEADIDALQKAVVPRGEHTEKWAEQRRVDDGIEHEVADLRDRLKGFVPSEAVALIVKQLDDLERRFNATRG